MKNKQMSPKVLFMTSVILATLACSKLSLGPTPTATPKPGPTPGAWSATIAFALPSGNDIVQVSFTVAAIGDRLDDWSMFDFGTRTASFGQPVPITDNSFEIKQESSNGGASITHDLKGTFTSPDSVEGTYDFSYGGFGSASGTWTGSPSESKKTPAANGTAIAPTALQPTTAAKSTAASDGGIPVITTVILAPETNGGRMTIYQHIYFKDSDGDVNNVDYRIISSTVTGLWAQGSPVDIPRADQIAGTYFSGTWDCGTNSYKVTLAAILSDRAGHTSAPYEYQMICGQG